MRPKPPMLAAGDDLWLQAAYQQGAYPYQDSGASFSQSTVGPSLGRLIHIDMDVVIIHPAGTPAGSYSLEEGEEFFAVAIFIQQLETNLHDVLFGSYEQIGYGGAVKNTDWTRVGIGDASECRIGNWFLFDPVKDLEIGVEFDHLHIDDRPPLGGPV